MAFAASSTEGSRTSSNINANPRNQIYEGALAVAPWSPKILSTKHPLPRSGFAYNSTAGKGVELLVFGGETGAGVMNDLWEVHQSGSAATQVMTTGTIPEARSGAKAVLVGNAFIVFGGTALNPAKKEDSHLHLLNTVTKVWSFAQINGKRPSSRSGHSFSLIGSKVFVFGGQPSSRVGQYANDLWTFDINSLFAAEASWEVIPDAGPCPRANHVAVTHLGKLYVFGGTDGSQTFHDVWVFDPITLTWTEILPHGYIPSSRHSHSAVVVSGVMYVFGGIDETGEHLADFIALNLGTSYWHQFESLGPPAPPARAHHALCNIGPQMYIIGGDVLYPLNNDTAVYTVDARDIKFPAEKPGFTTKNSNHAKLTSSNLLAALKSSPSAAKDADSQSIMSTARSVRSIRSIRTDLGRRVSAALSTTEADELLNRIFATVQKDPDMGLTAADMKALDDDLKGSGRSSKRNSGKALLNYFRPSKPTLEKKVKRDNSGATAHLRLQDQLQAKRRPGSVLSMRPESISNDFQAMDLERFLNLERMMYKETPKSNSLSLLHNARVPSIHRSVMPPVSRDMEVPPTDLVSKAHESGSNVAPPLAKALSRSPSQVSLRRASSSMDKMNVLRRLGLGPGDKSVPTVPENETTTTETKDNAAAPETELVSPDNVNSQKPLNPSNDPRILLHALSLLRIELINQKRKFVADRNAAYTEASRLVVKAEREANDKMMKQRALDEVDNIKIREQLTAAKADLEAHQQNTRSLTKETLSANEELKAVKEQLKELQLSHKDATEELARYLTIEAEAAEMAARQTIQVELIERMSSQIGLYQMRAAKAEKKLEDETIRSHELEKELLGLTTQQNDMELKMKHYQRLSSLSKYSSESSAQEAEASRDILIKNLRKLLDHTPAESVESVESLDVPEAGPQVAQELQLGNIGDEVVKTPEGLNVNVVPVAVAASG